MGLQGMKGGILHGGGEWICRDGCGLGLLSRSYLFRGCLGKVGEC